MILSGDRIPNIVTDSQSIFVFDNGPMDRNVAWFSDVRNPHHPYHQEYLKVMNDPIFSNPKVYKWSGDLDSSLGEHPGIKAERQLKELTGLKNKYDEALIRCMLPKLKGENIIIYGAGVIGQRIANSLLKERDLYGELVFAESVKKCDEQCGLPVFALKDLKGKEAIVVIAVRGKYRNEMEKNAENLGFNSIIAEDF